MMERELVGSELSDAKALALCIQAMKNVTYCFDSMEEDVINCKHPSCKELLLNIINKVEGR